jgi:hypothetical protein
LANWQHSIERSSSVLKAAESAPLVSVAVVPYSTSQMAAATAAAFTAVGEVAIRPLP